jgi:dolichyl-phosphate-mannose-protein mannosyltransferase
MRWSKIGYEHHTGLAPIALVLAALLTAASLLLHFLGLGTPSSVVFDEVHWGGFVNSYCCSGAYFFDIHPPYAKLIAASIIKLGGYEGGQVFDAIGTPLTDISPVLLRTTPAVFGSLIPVLIFTILLQLGVSRWGAFLGGWAALWDNALLLQTRILALDGLLVFAILAATALALSAAHQPRPIRRYLICLLTGSFVGLAVGIKMTGLAAGMIVAVVLLTIQVRNDYLKHLFVAYFCVGSAALLVYLSGWFLHFYLLGQPGPGDIWGVPSGNVLADTLNIHRTIMEANFGFDAPHPDSSKWWGWPWMWRPVHYFEGGGSIYFLGNPIVWWGTSIGVLMLVGKVILTLAGSGGIAVFRNSMPLKFMVPGVGFLISYIPYLFIPRVMFLYHYLPALVFAIIGVAAVLDSLGWMRLGGLSRQPARFLVLLCAIPVGFAVASPFTFGAEWEFYEVIRRAF